MPLSAQRSTKAPNFDRFARIYVGPTNKNPCDVIDGARRQLDHLGRAGILAKRHQTNGRYRSQGFLEFKFESLEARRKWQGRVEQLCDPALKVTYIKRPR